MNPLIREIISISVSAVLIPLCAFVVRELWLSRIERVKIALRLESGDKSFADVNKSFAEVRAKQAEIESKLVELEIEIAKLKARKD
jgi:septal ring factor EnvC (AmiA/AmiB activator)